MYGGKKRPLFGLLCARLILMFIITGQYGITYDTMYQLSNSISLEIFILCV